MLYLVGMTPAPSVTFAQVQKVLGEHAHDFYRFMDWGWIVCTRESAPVWSDRLKRFVTPGGTVMVCRFDARDNQGWMEKDFWTWFNAHAAH